MILLCLWCEGGGRGEEGGRGRFGGGKERGMKDGDRKSG
jgi:hypothetical protein